MKKLFTLLSISLTTLALGQSFSAFKTVGSSTVTALTNGYVLNEATTATTNTNSPAVTATKVRIQNNSSVNTVTLNVIRTVVYQSPALKLDGGGSFPDSYFCFGYSCFGSNVNTATSTDYTVLGPNQTSDAAGQPFLLDLVEGTSLGKYFIRYKLFNVNDANDTLSFTVRYNEFLSVNENNSILDNVSEIYPNPSSNSAFLNFTLKQENTVKVQVYNSLGALVYNGTEQKLMAGKNKIAVDCSNLNSGIYFVSLSANGSKATKRLVINK